MIQAKELKDKMEFAHGVAPIEPEDWIIGDVRVMNSIVVVRMTEWKKRPRFDIRKWVRTSSGEWTATKSGVQMDPDVVPEMIAASMLVLGMEVPKKLMELAQEVK